MPGVWNPFPIETSDAETAIFLIAWEMTKLNLYNRPAEYTADDAREEFALNYRAVYDARRQARDDGAARVAKRS